MAPDGRAGSAAAQGAGTGGFVTAHSDRGLTPLDQSLAGCTAKAATKLVLYPLDTWKSRRQARRLGAVIQFDGLWTLSGIYRGVVPKLLLYSPYQAIYMAVYVQARDELMLALAPFSWGRSVGFVMAGITAEIVASLVRLPMEVSKLRLQLGVYKSTRQAAMEFVRHPKEFYGNFLPQTLLHDCAYSACAWWVFETSRQWVFARREQATLSPSENLALGTVTGAVTALVTTPLDVIKTRVVGTASGRPPGLAVVGAVARGLLREEGYGGFWHGAALRVTHLAPAHGLYMLLYEAAKSQIAFWRGVNT